MAQKLEQIQRKLMLNVVDNSLWMQKKSHQSMIQHHALEQEMGPKNTVNWFLISYKNTKFFKISTTIEKRQNYIWTWIWCVDKQDILKVFTNEFRRRFKRDPDTIPHQAIPLSRDISICDNEWLTRDATKDELRVAFNLVSPLKAGMDAILYQKCRHIIGKNICCMIVAF